MLAARCGWRIASNLSKPPSNLPKLSHWMVLWFRETRTAAQGLWMTFKPGMELYLEANAIVEIKWGDQGGVCEGGQLPSSQDSHGQTVLIGAIKTALKTLKKLVYGV